MVLAVAGSAGGVATAAFSGRCQERWLYMASRRRWVFDFKHQTRKFSHTRCTDECAVWRACTAASVSTASAENSAEICTAAGVRGAWHGLHTPPLARAS